MFNFTTTHVINSSKDLTSDKDLWLAENGTLQIKGVNIFKKENVKSVCKAPYVESDNAKVTIDFQNISGLTKGDTLRLSLYVRLTEADQCSYYANDTRYKGRPFTIEFPWLGTTAKTLNNLAKLIKRYGLLVFEKEVITPSLNSTDSPTILTLTATNEFQRFKDVKLEKFVEGDDPYKDKYVEVSGATITHVKKGTEGFGTYGWILRNIKLPTNANTQAFAAKQNEMPIPGAKYTQYTIHYCVDRGPLGLNAVGDSVKSVTTNVFYVKSDFIDSFETAIKTAFGITDMTVTGTKYKEFPVSASLEDLSTRVTALEEAGE